ncbi:ThuA domain-containing protein [Deinococcus pimensis]|uniref:ThuA domain-containing protein n=1 Tax=Deinococcus pimensis TaxID=309888 RepID=UPI0004AEE713|nr:ThuA domain-containing protein [Deinococcus pimensis]
MTTRRYPRLTLLLAPLLLVGCAATSASTDEARPDPAPPAEQATPFDVLVYTRTTGFRHASIDAGVDAVRALGTANGFAVTRSENPADFTDDKLKRFKVVMFLNTTGDVLDTNGRGALERFVRAGGGFVGVHSATDTEYGWPWYGRLVGAYFDGHPQNPNVREGRLNVTLRDHPATRDLPDPWVRSEEWYSFRSVSPQIRPLLKLDEASFEAGGAPRMGDHPVAWFQEFEGGRSFYTALGHEASTFADPLFRKHLLGGILWAAGRD